MAEDMRTRYDLIAGVTFALLMGVAIVLLAVFIG